MLTYDTLLHKQHLTTPWLCQIDTQNNLSQMMKWNKMKIRKCYMACAS